MTSINSLSISFPKMCKAEIIRNKLDGFTKLNSNQVFIRTLKSLISPGTELAYFEGKHTDFKTGKRSFPTSPPGYSSVGIIEAVGEDIDEFKVGDRVLAMSGHANVLTPPNSYLTAVPENLDSESATFGVMGSIALHGLREANIQYGSNVMITGMGMVGQIALRLARLCPAKNVIAVDMFNLRLSIAKQGGADYCINLSEESLEDAVAKITSNRGCDTVIEASGNAKALPSALKCTANRGKIVILGSLHGIAELNLYMELQKKEISLVGSYQPNCPQVETAYTPWSQKKNRMLILDYLDRNKLDFSSIITHRTSWQEAPELYTLLSKHKDQALGAIIDWENK